MSDKEYNFKDLNDQCTQDAIEFFEVYTEMNIQASLGRDWVVVSGTDSEMGTAFFTVGECNARTVAHDMFCYSNLQFVAFMPIQRFCDKLFCLN